MPTLTNTNNLTSSSLTNIDMNKQEDESNTIIKVKTPKAKHILTNTTAPTSTETIKNSLGQFKSRSPSPSLVVLLTNKVNAAAAAAAATSSSFRMTNTNNCKSIKNSQHAHTPVNRAHSLKLPRTSLLNSNIIVSQNSTKNFKKTNQNDEQISTTALSINTDNEQDQLETRRNKTISTISPSLLIKNNISLAQAEIDDDDLVIEIDNENSNDLNTAKSFINYHLDQNEQHHDDVEFVDEDDDMNAHSNTSSTNSNSSSSSEEINSNGKKSVANSSSSSSSSSAASSTTNTGTLSTSSIKLDELSSSSSQSISVDCGITNNVNLNVNAITPTPQAKVNHVQNYKASFSTSLMSPVNTCTNTSASTTIAKQILAPEEKISTEAKAYWATIDLYNNSKLAFNKRLRSVKQKREKLNAELVALKQNQQTESPIKTPSNTVLCTCVKCSIVYHEAMIKGITDVNSILCKKCKNKLVTCKCCSSSTTGNEPVTSVIQQEQPVTIVSNPEVNSFEEKLFSIKNELVDLSETSLDVFQLLLQLSDTMLELNTQLNTSVNSNQLFLNNNNNFSINSSRSCLIDELTQINENENDDSDDNYDETIENIYSNSRQVSSKETSSTKQNVVAGSNSISSIINTLNNRTNTKNVLIQSPPSRALSPAPLLSPNSTLHQTYKSALLSNNKKSPCASATQFVDSLLNNNNNNNHNHNSNNKEATSTEDSGNSLSLANTATDDIYSTGSSGSSSGLSIKHDDNFYDCIDEKYLPQQQQQQRTGYKLATTPITNQILARQPYSAIVSKHQQQQPMKSSTSTSSSSSSSSSGCGGSSSMCSSSNNDLASLPVSTCSSTSSSSIVLLASDSTNQNNNAGRRSLSTKNNSLMSDSSSTYSSTNNSKNNTYSQSLYRNSMGAPTIVSAAASSLLVSSNTINKAKLSIDTSINYPLLSTISTKCGTSFKHNNLNHNQQQPLSPGSVAGLAASFISNTNANSSFNQHQFRSNSVNAKHTNSSSIQQSGNEQLQQIASNLNHSASIANRKPSFKFESSILNRVQNMNLNNKIRTMSTKNSRQQNQQSTSQAHLNNNQEDDNDDVFSKSTNSSHSTKIATNGMVTTNEFIKRASLNSNNSINQHYNNYEITSHIKRQQSINKIGLNTSIHNQQSRQIHQYETTGKSNNHQISLDSGIYLPSESEENSLSSGLFK